LARAAAGTDRDVSGLLRRTEDTDLKRIYSVLVENRAGVLCKVAGLFWRRCFNIESLAVGETDNGRMFPI
jgi:hypothetical protein